MIMNKTQAEPVKEVKAMSTLEKVCLFIGAFALGVLFMYALTLI